jgi:hypothetical protein
MSRTILFLDNMPERIPILLEGYMIHYARNGEEFKAWLLANGTPDVIRFDHDLAEEHYVELSKDGILPESTEMTGEDCARWAIENNFISNHVHVHSWNHGGAKRIARLFFQTGARVTLHPFSGKRPSVDGPTVQPWQL